MKSKSSNDSKSVSSSGSKFGNSMPEWAKGSPQRGLKEIVKKLVDSEVFIKLLSNRFLESEGKSSSGGRYLFDSPFQLDELQEFDYALEGTRFHQLLRMPSGTSPSTPEAIETEAYLALEDFMHTAGHGLWRKFWSKDEPVPLYISCPYGAGSKFYTLDKAIARGKLGGLGGVALLLKNGNKLQGDWDHVLELALLRDNVFAHSHEAEQMPSFRYVAQALFYGLHMLMARTLSKTSALKTSDTAYILVVDCQFGGVVRIQGDVNKMNVNISKPYDCAVDWIVNHADVTVSPFEQIWNRLGNANWGDIGTLQLLLATFHSTMHCKGPPNQSLAELAAEYQRRLEKRKIERQLLGAQENGREALHGKKVLPSRREIVEIEEEQENFKRSDVEEISLEPGTVLWLEDSHWQRGFQIHQLIGDVCPLYSASSLEEPGKLLAVYIGSHPSSWEDMSMWYQVQRQTKVLTKMKQLGISNKHLPQIIASGRIRHPGSCDKQSPGDRCNHPWCGIPILVTYPIGDSVSATVNINGKFSTEEALRCCHDCLSALQSTSSAGIHHGDIIPDNIIRIAGADRHSYFVLVNWGHAVLEDRDAPALNLQFSSTSALQEGKLCPASDVESLVYVLYNLSGGSIPFLDSLEAALQWREGAWARREIQQKLGEVSAVLKAFADYADSLCSTPYMVDYDIWLRRINKTLHGDNYGKMVDSNITLVRTDDVPESSGTSAASLA